MEDDSKIGMCKDFMRKKNWKRKKGKFC